MNILVTMSPDKTRDTFIPTDIVSRIEGIGNVVWNESEDNYSPSELREKLKDIELCICGWGCSRFDSYVLEESNKLKIVAYTGGSLAPIVSEDLYDRGIKVLSGNAIFAESVAEGVIAYAMCSLRELPYNSNLVQTVGWGAEEFENEGLLDQSIGLVGFGMVAKHLVNLLKSFRCKIKVYDPFITDETCMQYGVESASLEDIFTKSKIISIHAPRTPETYHMINKALLQKIPDGTLLINTARGNIIDESSLAEELIKCRFKAILDVFEVEPLPSSSKLRGLRNVILIPHMAGPTIDRRKFVTMALLDDVDNFYVGKPLRCEISRDYAMGMTR